MDYTELKNTVKLYTKDPLTNSIDGLVKMAESRIERDLFANALEATYTFNGADGQYRFDVPDDFRTQQYCRLINWLPAKELIYVLPQDMVKRSSITNPDYYTIDNYQVVFETDTTSTMWFTLRYRVMLNLVDQLTNRVLDRYPDVYINAVLLEAAYFRRDKEFLGQWIDRYQASIKTANEEQALENSQATMVIENNRQTLGGTYGQFMAGD